MDNIQNRIKELREEKSITQVRLGVDLEVTQETISAYEIGKHFPSAKSLLRMAKLFDASIDYIMGLSSIRKPIIKENLPDDEVNLLILYRGLNNTAKEKTHAYIQGLSDKN